MKKILFALLFIPVLVQRSSANRSANELRNTGQHRATQDTMTPSGKPDRTTPNDTGQQHPSRAPPHLKTGRAQALVGSNPTPSAFAKGRRPDGLSVWMSATARLVSGHSRLVRVARIGILVDCSRLT